MRTTANLVRMLDGIGLADALGIRSTMSLFGEHQHLLHSMSVIKDAAFYNGKPYKGDSPSLSRKTRPFQQYFSPTFDELELLPDALIVPLGSYVNKFIKHYVEEECRYPDQYLLGFPHPSPGNGHREEQYATRQSQLREGVRKFFSAVA